MCAQYRILFFSFRSQTLNNKLVGTKQHFLFHQDIKSSFFINMKTFRYQIISSSFIFFNLFIKLIWSRTTYYFPFSISHINTILLICLNFHLIRISNKRLLFSVELKLHYFKIFLNLMQTGIIKSRPMNPHISYQAMRINVISTLYKVVFRIQILNQIYLLNSLNHPCLIQ